MTEDTSQYYTPVGSNQVPSPTTAQIYDAEQTVPEIIPPRMLFSRREAVRMLDFSAIAL